MSHEMNTETNAVTATGINTQTNADAASTMNTQTNPDAASGIKASALLPAEKPKPTITKREAMTLLPPAAAIAALYAVCFSGIRVLPQISFTLFCPVALIILTTTLNRMGIFHNKKAFWWALPIMILALFNGIFHANPFTWGNALLTHMLFAAFTLTALRDQPLDLFSFGGLFTAVRMVLGDWMTFFGAVRVVLERKPLPAASAPGTTAAAPPPASAGTAKKILLGVLISLPVLLIITALLASADAVFGRMLSELGDTIGRVKWLNTPFIISFLLVWVYALGYTRLGTTLSRNIKVFNESFIPADTTICATFLVLVNAVFMVFTFIQAAFLFNGGFLKLPEDMVYSGYAREGFFQLLFVTCINFAVIIIFMTLLNYKKNSGIIKILLFMLCAFTGVLIASSFYRMGLYTGAYGHTTLRLQVYTFLTMEIVLLTVTVWKLLDNRVRFIKWYALTGLVFYILVNITGSDFTATQLNKALFLSGKMPYIDLVPVGPDGLRVLQPMFEDDAYVCAEYHLMRANEWDGELPVNADGYTLYAQDYTYYASDYPESLRQPHDPSTAPFIWQNWSYLKNRP